MVDTSNEEQITVADVVVVGAGLAGLTAAAVAAERPGGRVVVLDTRPPGGQARTDERNGFTFNRGPRALYRGGPARSILDGLGVTTTTGGKPTAKGAMVRRAGALHLLPQGVSSGARSSVVGLRDLAQMGPLMARLPQLDTTALAGRPLQDWIDENRLRPVVADLVRMLARVATYTDAPDQLDAGAALRNMQLALGDGVQYLDGGFQSLVDGLLGVLAERGVALRQGPAGTVRELGRTELGVAVSTDAGPIEARSVVLAAGGPEVAARLLGGAPASWNHLGPAPTAACLELGVRRPPRHRVVFGLDEPTYLSTHCPPANLAPPGQAVVHVMRYQRPGDAMPAGDQQTLLREVAASAGIIAADIVEDRFLARMTVTGPIPTASTGGLTGRPTAEVPGHPGVFLAGDWVGPTGLLTDASVASGHDAGRRAVARASRIAVA